VDPQHDTLDSLASYLGKLIHEQMADSGIAAVLDFPLELPAGPSRRRRHNLFLAFKEALHNVLKHSTPPRCASPSRWRRTASRSNSTTMRVLTRRPARSPRALAGTGCQHVAPAPEIGDGCEIHSTPGGGTRVTFFLPARKTTK